MKRTWPVLVLALLGVGVWWVATHRAEPRARSVPSDHPAVGTWVFDAARVVDGLAEQARAAVAARDPAAPRGDVERRRAEDALAGGTDVGAAQATTQALLGDVGGRFVVRSDGTATLSMDRAPAVEGTWTVAGEVLTWTPRAEGPGVPDPPTTFRWDGRALNLVLGEGDGATVVALRRP
jgi:hypothetical protein